MLNATTRQSTSRHEFLLDSGASCHMSPNQEWLRNVHPIQTREIRLGDNSIVTAEAAGTLILKVLHCDESTTTLFVNNVLYIPQLTLGLLSCSRMAEKGVDCVFDKYGCSLIDRSDSDKILARARLQKNLYWLTQVEPVPSGEHAQTASAPPTTEEVNTWHNRLAHVNKTKVAAMLRNHQITHAHKQYITDKCSDCSMGKQT